MDTLDPPAPNGLEVLIDGLRKNPDSLLALGEICARMNALYLWAAPVRNRLNLKPVSTHNFAEAHGKEITTLLTTFLIDAEKEYERNPDPTNEFLLENICEAGESVMAQLEYALRLYGTGHTGVAVDIGWELLKRFYAMNTAMKPWWTKHGITPVTLEFES